MSNEDEDKELKETWHDYLAKDIELYGVEDEEPFWRCHHGRAYGIRCSGCRREEEEEDD